MSFEKKIIEVNIYATEIRDKPGCMDPGHVQTSKTQSTDVSNGLRPHYAREIWNTAITGHFEYVFEEDSNKGSHMIIAMSSLARSSVLQTFSVHTKMQSERFQIPPVGRAFSKSFVLVTD